MNQETGDLFKPEDLLPGKIVSVFNHTFEMLEMDDYSRKTFEDPDTVHKKFDLAVIMEKFRESMREKAIHMNQETGDLFKPEDLLPGKIVSVFNHTFEMLEMDDYSRKTFEDPDTVHKKFD